MIENPSKTVIRSKIQIENPYETVNNVLNIQIHFAEFAYWFIKILAYDHPIL